MAERIVRGWKVSIEKLNGLVGSKSLTAAEILETDANDHCRTDVLMSLGDGDVVEGTKLAQAALADILSGDLKNDHSARYSRVIEPLLNVVGIPLGVTDDDQILLQLTYYVPNESHGRWNPLLETCNMPRLSQAWAAPNLDFPWQAGQGPDRGKWPWPIWTTIDASELIKLQPEFESVTRKRLNTLPSDELTDDDEDDEYLSDCRDELWGGLQRLNEWIDHTLEPEKAEGAGWSKSDNALVLLMDGDQ